MSDNEAAKLLNDYVAEHAPRSAWRCKARAAGTAGGNDPQDCDWPLCGCDPHADKVIETLNESGFYVVPGEANKAMTDAALEADPQPQSTRADYERTYRVMVERSQKP